MAMPLQFTEKFFEEDPGLIKVFDEGGESESESRAGFQAELEKLSIEESPRKASIEGYGGS